MNDKGSKEKKPHPLGNTSPLVMTTTRTTTAGPPEYYDDGESTKQNLTDLYRRDVLDLTELYNTEISWITSQQTLDTLWSSAGKRSSLISYDNINKKSLTTTPANNNNYQQPQTSPTSYCFACQECGYMLYPGWKGTNLRIRRPDQLKQFSITSSSESTTTDATATRIATRRKTVRRREQRKRKSIARNKQMERTASSSSRMTTMARPTTAASSSSNFVLLENDITLSQVRRNHVLLTCGRCHGKVYLAGMKKSSNNSNPPKHHQQQQIANVLSYSSRTTVSKSPQQHDHATASTNLDYNFEPLPSLNERPSMSEKRKVSSANQKLLSPLEQRELEKFGPKKKKKKTNNHEQFAGNNSNNNKKKNNNLMDFLSSLNDP
jgi:hypothetical protein